MDFLKFLNNIKTDYKDTFSDVKWNNEENSFYQLIIKFSNRQKRCVLLTFAIISNLKRFNQVVKKK
jgi:hypothetical protein